VKPWQSLSSRKEFLRTLKAGKRAEGGFLFLRLLPAGPGRKIGFSTKSGFKNAVHRNRAKRWMREAVRENLSLLPEGANLILVAKPGMQAAEFSSVADEVRRLLTELA
jgi:ribonuclease P protein component